MTRYEELVSIRAGALAKSRDTLREFEAFARQLVEGVIRHFEVPGPAWSYVPLDAADAGDIRLPVSLTQASGFGQDGVYQVRFRIRFDETGGLDFLLSIHRTPSGWVVRTERGFRAEFNTGAGVEPYCDALFAALQASLGEEFTPGPARSPLGFHTGL
jgi:hypothetical protein